MEECDKLLKGFVELIKELDTLAKTRKWKKGKATVLGADITYRYSARYLLPYDKPKSELTEMETSKPIIEVFDKGEYVIVTASIPNVKEEDLKCEVVNNTLKISLKSKGTSLVKEISIPENSKVDKILNVTFKNGVLDVKLRKKPSNLER